MSRRNKKAKLDSSYEDRILDEYLAAKDALDAVQEREYGAGLSGVSEHSAITGDDDYSFNFGEDPDADLDFTKSAAAATAAAAAEVGLDMSAYLNSANGLNAQDASPDDSAFSDASSKASKKSSRKRKRNKSRDTLSDESYFDDDEISMTASEEGLERFMRSLGFDDEEDETTSTETIKTEVRDDASTVTSTEINIDTSDVVGDSFGPAIGVKSPLDGRFDLRKGRVGNALGEGTPYPLLDLDGDYSALPSPEVLAAYPAEVQRKIIEWTDRDVRARRDNESLRQDIMLREKIAQRKIVLFFAVLIVVVCIVCAVATSVLLRDAIYAVVFLLIPMIVVVAALVWLLGFGVTKR